ncbi:MAG: LysE/ArgO family amino acid transporter [Pseudomonadota bacterium]
MEAGPLAVAGTGFATGLGLILAIGAQNAFVLRQGLARLHVLPVALTCALSDAVLIAAGVAGFSALTTRAPWLIPALTWAGAAFLIAYGALRLRAALGPAEALLPQTGARQSLASALAQCLAFTWANPHVYLDTLGLLGALGAAQPAGLRPAFALGAVTASFVFFFALAYGARLLAPLFARPSAWRALDLAIAALMWTIAAGLLL